MKGKQKETFAFLVHSRSISDMYKKFPILKKLPESLSHILIKYWPPIIVSKITGLKSKEGQELSGCIIGIPMTARQMIEDRSHALKQIKKSVKIAEKRGIKLIGFGALTASFSKGGKDVLENIETLGITTGRAYTTKTVTGYVKKCVKDFNFPIDKVTIGIVGAAGSIGSSCAKILAKEGFKNFIFIDLDKKAERLEFQIKEIEKNDPEVKILISHQVSAIKDANIIIAATNAPEVLIKSDDLLPGAIVINDAQPSDVSPDIIKSRDDVLIIEGGVINTPGIRCNFNLGLASPNDTFCCLGEVLILAHEGKFEHFAIGELDEKLIEKIDSMGQTLNFGLSPFQNDLGYISNNQIENVRKIINSKRS